MSNDSERLFNRPLPSSLDAERFVLGAILIDQTNYSIAAAQITADDFSLEKHRRIWNAIGEVITQGLTVDRVVVAEQLQKNGQLESVDGVSYLIELDNGLPQIFAMESYLVILQEKSRLRSIIRVLFNNLSRGMQQDAPEEIVTSVTNELLGIESTSRKRGMVSTQQIIEQYPGGLEAFLSPWKQPRGVRTGYYKLDEMTGGLQNGDLVILAARPSMGKTAFALDIVRHVSVNSEEPGVSAVFSMEMSVDAMMARMVTAQSMVDSSKFRAGYLNRDERRQLQDASVKIAQAPIYIDDTPGLTLYEMQTKLRRLQQQQGLSLVVLDYLQLMTGMQQGTPNKKESGRSRAENRTQEVSMLTRGLKLLAKEMNVPFVVLSQLSRAPEQRPGGHGRPQLSDLRESGSIEQDADLVGFIYRREVYQPDRDDAKGKATLIIAKQRNGPTGDVNLVFLREYTRFENLAEDLPLPL